MNAAMLTDVELDNAFHQSWNVKDYPTAAIYGNEIRDRLTTIGGFLDGLLGRERFPKYASINEGLGAYTQVQAAQSSLSDATGNVIDNITGAVGDVVDKAKSGLTITAVVVVVVAVAAFAIATRK